jgi:hypothetical protein
MNTNSPNSTPRPGTTSDDRYEAPTLLLIGQASDVILGLPGGGFDGPFEMSEPRFAFEDDSRQQA